MTFIFIAPLLFTRQRCQMVYDVSELLSSVTLVEIMMMIIANKKLITFPVMWTQKLSLYLGQCFGSMFPACDLKPFYQHSVIRNVGFSLLPPKIHCGWPMHYVDNSATPNSIKILKCLCSQYESPQTWYTSTYRHSKWV